VNRRLLVPLGLGVVALLVVAAVAASAHPLGGGGRGSGPTPTFLDYVFTTFVILGIALMVLFVWGVFTTMPERARNRKLRKRRNFLALMLYLAACIGLGWALTHSSLEKRLQRAQKHPTPVGEPNVRGGKRANQRNPNGRNAQLRWDEVAIVLAVLGACGVAAFAARSRHRPTRLPWRLASRQSLSDALDESLDDLRSEPNLRTAIIAAYARMERSLAVVGIARHPAEAPLEYVERALAELHASADAARRLTDLFEWAKFSQHEPEPQMRDDAIDALVAVRDELRSPEQAEEPNTEVAA
jgi:hypothetical protein